MDKIPEEQNHSGIGLAENFPLLTFHLLSCAAQPSLSADSDLENFDKDFLRLSNALKYFTKLIFRDSDHSVNFGPMRH